MKSLEQVRDEWIAANIYGKMPVEYARAAWNACLAHLSSVAVEFDAQACESRLDECHEQSAVWNRESFREGARWQFDRLKAVIGAWEEKFLQSVRVGAQYKIDMEKQLAAKNQEIERLKEDKDRALLNLGLESVQIVGPLTKTIAEQSALLKECVGKLGIGRHRFDYDDLIEKLKTHLAKEG